MSVMASGHRVGGMSYIAALIGLLALTALSFGLSQVELGALGPTVALGIAAVKALVVLWYFMHLIEEGFVMRVVTLIALIYIAFLCLGMVADIEFR